MEKGSYGMLFVAGVVALSAVGIAILTTNSTPQPTETIAVSYTTTPLTTGDADDDGVPDWKEILWGTDPQNADSDGDGISDGDEINQGTDPLREGTAVSAYVAPKALTPTESLSRELFVGYAASRQDGSLSVEEADMAALTALSTNVTNITSSPTYTLADLSIESDVSVTAYETLLNNIFKKTLQVREYELTTFSRALGNENFNELEPLVKATAIYTEVVQDLLIIEVPDILATQHLDVLNSMSSLAHATALLTTWNGDPLEGLNLVNNFVSAEGEFSTSAALLYAIIDNER